MSKIESYTVQLVKRILIYKNNWVLPSVLVDYLMSWPSIKLVVAEKVSPRPEEKCPAHARSYNPMTE